MSDFSSLVTLPGPNLVMASPDGRSGSLTIRSLTINDLPPLPYGTGSVTSVSVVGSTGISISGSPITTSGTITVTNTAPDQVVVLSSGTGISVSGTYPNFTIANTGGTVLGIHTSGPITGGTITTTGTIGFDYTYSGTFTNAIWHGGAIDLTTYVSGNLGVFHLNGGTGASSGTFWRGDGTWASVPIPSVGTWGALNYPTWVSGTPFVKMTAAGTFGLDTSTYITGNQTITLSSDVTGSGTTSITTTIATGAVTLAKMANLSAPSKIIGRYTTGAGVPQELTISTGLFLDGSGNLTSTGSGGTVTSVTGTANRIAVATGTTTPVIDIASTYVGQTSITTLGTITTGTLSTSTVIAGVTMTLGSDANYDTYYRNSSGVLTRLANGTTGQVLTATTSSAPTWTAARTGTVTSVATGAGLTGGTITTSGTVSIDTTYSNTWTALQEILLNPGANTIVDAIRLYNTTTSSLGNQMYPGAIHFQGQGWKNNITAASQTVDWRMYMVPVGGAAAANMNFIMDAQANGGGYIQQFIINQSTGLLTITGLLATSQVTATTGFALTGGKISITTGSNKSAGAISLSSGTITVSTTVVTANSLIFVQYQSGGTLSGATLTRGLRVSTQTAGASFVIVAETSPGTLNNLDNSPIQWWILN